MGFDSKPIEFFFTLNFRVKQIFLQQTYLQCDK